MIRRAVVHAAKAAGTRPTPASRQDPVLAAITEKYPPATPGLGPALAELGRMRRLGVELTVAIATNCIDDHIRRAVKAKPAPAPSLVYYIRHGGHIKIGTTRTYRARMDALLPELIYATEPGGRDIEKQRHQQFAHLLARRNEYFREAPELLRHIRTTRAIFGEPQAVPGIPTWDLT